MFGGISRSGRTFLRTHHWPTTDPYSFTAAGNPWIAYEWLGEIALALVYHAGGLVSLCIFLVAFGSIAILALYGLAAMRSKNSKAAFRIHGVVVCNLAGICIVHIAAANVWLPILDSDAVVDGEISPGVSFLPA